MIKAIETKYAGCRFRSRLEARWAVFFSELNIPWEYEPEGFQLADGVRYLPDFKIKTRWGAVWIEIKPRSFEPAFVPRVYLAGRIKGDDWRRSVYDEHRMKCCGPDLTDKHYVGPHGNSGSETSYPSICDVVADNTSRLKSADAVFAWIDVPDCYGTLVEIGQAAAYAVPVLLGIDEKIYRETMITDHYNHEPFDRSDFWVCSTLASQFGVYECVDAAAAAFFSADQEEAKMAAFAKAGNRIVVMSGDPVDCVAVEMHCDHRTVFAIADGQFGHVGGMNHKGDHAARAAVAARSARFEFGECG
jgi:nucleoside 2-deoxyribosyltransferase